VCADDSFIVIMCKSEWVLPSDSVKSILSEPMFAKCALEAQNVGVITYYFDAMPGNTHQEFNFQLVFCPRRAFCGGK